MNGRPSWLNEECPTWCRREHVEADHAEDRLHVSEAALVPAIAVSERGTHLTTAMHGIDMVVWVGRYVGEAFDWLVIEPAEGRDPHIVVSLDAAVLLVDGATQQLRLAGRFPAGVLSRQGS